VGWVAKHILAHIEELPAFCEKYGLDDERQASLRRVYETALEDLGKLPQDQSLIMAAGDLFYDARDKRDEILGIGPNVDE